jgi:hypothetical protein
MKNNLLLSVILLITSNLYSQNIRLDSLQNKSNYEKTITDIKFFGGFVHQHQDFFKKAFSFQGIETGVIFDHNMLFGLYGSTFVSNLEVEVANNPMYILMSQFGLIGGIMQDDSKFFHAGFLMNAGYFCLQGNNLKMALFNSAEHLLSIIGLVLAPQVFGEMNASYWMRIRIGLAYNFYVFENQSLITRSDVKGISFNFGFLFGRFN